MRLRVQRPTLMTDDVIFNIEVKFGLRSLPFNKVDLISIRGFPSLLQMQVTLRRNDFHILKGIGMRSGNPNAHFLAGGTVHRECVVKNKMAGLLRGRANRESQKAEGENDLAHNQLPFCGEE